MKELECTKCGEVKPMTKKYFSVRKDSKFGFRRTCIKCTTAQKREYRNRPKNKIKHRERSKKWREDNLELAIKMINDWEEKKGKSLRSTGLYWKKNYDKYKNDPIQKLKVSIRKRLWEYSKGKKRKSTSVIIGCTWEEFKIHIESQFTDGMTWDNYGFYGWHIDHIIPLASAKTEEEIYKLNHYTNLQPLWWQENFKKGDKIFDFS